MRTAEDTGASANGAATRAQVRQAFAEVMGDLEARLVEQAEDPERVRVELRRIARLDEESQAIERERINRTARRTLDHEDAEADLRLPPTRDDYTLAAYRAEPKVAKVERVEGLQRVAHKTLLVAAYKTGKTTLHANLTRSLSEGSQFLGRFAVKRVEGRVGIWNAEMEADDYESYLTAAGVTRADRVAIWNLRGYRLPLTSDAAAEAAVEWLRRNDVKYWIIDPWARVCAWAGADENSTAEVGPLLQRVDEIASDAGVAEVLVVHHAGHIKGRPRGATVLPDWADGIWMYTRDEESNRRYLKAEGRGVGLPEGLVEIDENGRTVYREVSRRAARVSALMDEMVAFVAANDGCTTSDAKATLSGGNDAKDEAVRKAVATGMLRQDPDPEDRRRKLLYFVSSEALI